MIDGSFSEEDLSVLPAAFDRGVFPGDRKSFWGVFFQGTGSHQSTILWKLLSGLTAEMFSQSVQYFLPSSAVFDFLSHSLLLEALAALSVVPRPPAAASKNLLEAHIFRPRPRPTRLETLQGVGGQPGS